MKANKKDSVLESRLREYLFCGNAFPPFYPFRPQPVTPAPGKRIGAASGFLSPGEAEAAPEGGLY